MAGDWHGQGKWAQQALTSFGRQGIRDVFQLGDFGLGWPTRHSYGGGQQMLDQCQKTCRENGINLRIIPGNHENWDWINALTFHDGFARVADNIDVVERNARFTLGHGRTVLALGGAPSIDFHHRTQGSSWWREEMITLEEAEAAAAGGHADIMLCHDAPSDSTWEVFKIIDQTPQQSGWPEDAIRYAKEGRTLMAIAVAGVQPKVFAHGHYHVADHRIVEPEGDGLFGTQYISLACDGMGRNLATLDLETLRMEWLSMWQPKP